MKIPSSYSPIVRAKRNFYRLGGGQLHALRLYLGSMQKAMRNEMGALEKEYQEQLRKYPQDGYDINEAFRMNYSLYEKTYQRILMESCYVTALALFEIIYRKICVFTAGKFSRVAELDFKNNIIENYNNYMKKELKINLSDSQLLVNWTQLLMYKEFRNRIVHHSSGISAKNVKLRKFLKRKEGLKIVKKRNEDLYLVTILERSFIIEFINTAEAYLINVLSNIPAKRRGYKLK